MTLGCKTSLSQYEGNKYCYYFKKDYVTFEKLMTKQFTLSLYIYIYIYISVSLPLSFSLYIYIYISLDFVEHLYVSLYFVEPI